MTFYFKALHIIFVVTWFSGLFYIVRLFIYYVEANERPCKEREILQNQFKIMQKRLWYGITWPSLILTVAFGPFLLKDYIPLQDHPWLITKLIFVLFLILYHVSCGKILKELHKYTSRQLRIWNEVATFFLFSIVFLAVFKESMTIGIGLLGLGVLVLALFVGFVVYYVIRNRK